MRSLRSPIVATVLAILAGACASTPNVAPKTQVRLDAPPASVAAAPLPPLPPLANEAAIVDAKAPRLTTLTAVNQDVGVVVRELAAKFGLQYRIDPAVRGLVNTAIHDKTLAEALTSILPAGVTYQIRDGVLTVAPARVATRIFSLDYVALSRFGTASTVIQRRLGGGFGTTSFGTAGLAVAAPSSAGGADVISGVSVADVWEEIRVAVEALVFEAADASSAVAPGAMQATQAGGVAITSGGRSSSRTSADGRRVIVNPIAGTITVSAFPEKLDQVDTFIRTFESSIQRQVLIEAKIVEVNLDRSFEFGIDWNVVSNLGKSGTLSVRSRNANPAPASNVELTLTGGSTQITAVLSALSTQGDVRVLSSPRVSALNNQRAIFDVTTGEIVFNLSRTFVPNANGSVTPITQVTPTQVNVGIVLDVLPQIGADNTVTMNIRPAVTSVARTASFSDASGTLFQAPVIDTRESDTMARLRAGETIIIGGLMQTRRERVRGGIPILRDIPLLGLLFSNSREVERKAELVIFLTPTIIAGQPVATR